MKVSLNWLKDYVRVQTTPEALAEKLTMAGLEVKKFERIGSDTIFETEITTNRPDWLSHVGVAREIHALTGGAFKLPDTRVKIEKSKGRTFLVAIPKEDLDLCSYYSACLLEGVGWGQTPAFMKERLEACGIRSINFPVDVTNYVLLEMGQPLHAFDANLLHGENICARRARAGEKITAIDGTDYRLEKNDLIIADEAGPIAIGGVMGGKESEVNDRTTDILLESAFFAPSTVRRTSRRLKLISESSYRFERRVDPGSVDKARERAVYLFQKYGKVERVSGVFCHGKLPIRQQSVRLSMEELRKVLGVSIPESQASRHLTRLGLSVKHCAGGVSVQVPSFRSDISGAADLIEEVTRIYGYDRIPETLPSAGIGVCQKNVKLSLIEQIRNLAVGMGYDEAVSFTLINPEILEAMGHLEGDEALNLVKERWVRVQNPQNQALTLMRPTLSVGFMEAVRRNFSVQENAVRLFEIGNRYLAKTGKELPLEECMVGFVLSGSFRGNWLEHEREVSFYDMKGTLNSVLKYLKIDCQYRPCPFSIYEVPESAIVEMGGKVVGTCGLMSKALCRRFDVDKPVYYGVLSLDKLTPLAQQNRTFEEFPKFPSSVRDLTLILADQVSCADIEKRIVVLGGAWVRRLELFDLFKGEKIGKGKKSLSFRITYQSLDRTLVNEEVNQKHFAMIDQLAKEFGAELPKN